MTTIVLGLLALTAFNGRFLWRCLLFKSRDEIQVSQTEGPDPAIPRVLQQRLISLNGNSVNPPISGYPFVTYAVRTLNSRWDGEREIREAYSTEGQLVAYLVLRSDGVVAATYWDTDGQVAGQEYSSQTTSRYNNGPNWWWDADVDDAQPPRPLYFGDVPPP